MSAPEPTLGDLIVELGGSLDRFDKLVGNPRPVTPETRYRDLVESFEGDTQDQIERRLTDAQIATVVDTDREVEIDAFDDDQVGQLSHALRSGTWGAFLTDYKAGLRRAAARAIFLSLGL